MTTPDLSPAEYVALEGNFCPNCQSSEFGSIPDTGEIIGATYSLQMRCHTCNSTWFDHYNLADYSALHTPPVDAL